jgi:hypothetical protein
VDPARGSSISGKSPSLPVPPENPPQRLVAWTIVVLEATNKLAQVRGHLRLLQGQHNSQALSYLLANGQIVFPLKVHIAHRGAPVALEEETVERPARFLLGYFLNIVEELGTRFLVCIATHWSDSGFRLPLQRKLRRMPESRDRMAGLWWIFGFGIRLRTKGWPIAISNPLCIGA